MSWWAKKDMLNTKEFMVYVGRKSLFKSSHKYIQKYNYDIGSKEWYERALIRGIWPNWGQEYFWGSESLSWPLVVKDKLVEKREKTHSRQKKQKIVFSGSNWRWWQYWSKKIRKACVNSVWSTGDSLGREICALNEIGCWV